MPAEHQSEFCIFINTVCEGAVLSVRDERGLPFVFHSRIEAEREIIETAMERMKEYLDGTREFEDALTIEEYVVEVKVLPDGSVEPQDGTF